MFISTVLLFLVLACNMNTYVTSCSQKESADIYLDIASDMILKAKSHIPSSNSDRNPTQKPVDCSDILREGHNKSGVYTIWPLNRLTEDQALEVYCDMDTDGGGWTLIQRRGDFSNPVDYFFKDWVNYKVGFGNIQEDFWLGNDYIFALTNQKLYSIRFDLEDMESNTAYAQYDTFWIDDENHKYTLHISGYNGNAGGDSMALHNGNKFSTKDQENDNQANEVCAEKYKGGWWYNDCHRVNLNGLYLKGKTISYADGINWYHWKGYQYSLKTTEMKIRPRKFLLPEESLATPLR